MTEEEKSMVERDATTHGRAFTTAVWLSAWLIAAGSGLQSSNLTPQLQAQGLSFTNPINHDYDVAADLGGAVIRDRLWFYEAWNRQALSTGLVGFAAAPGPDGRYLTADDVPGVFDTNLTSQTMKLSFQLSKNNRLIMAWLHDTKRQPEFAADRLRVLESTRNYVEPIDVYKGEIQTALSDRLLLNVVAGDAGYFANYKSNYSRPGHPPAMDIATGLRTGSNESLNQQPENRYQLHDSITYFPEHFVGGHHELKVGTEAYWDFDGLGKLSNGAGNYLLYYNNGVPFKIDIYNYPIQPHDQETIFAAYAKDSWRIRDGLTVNAGVRWQRQNVSLPAQSVGASPQFPTLYPAATFPEKRIQTWTSIVPRLGVAWSLNPETVVKTTFGVYNSELGFTFSDAYTQNATTTTTFRWTDPTHANDYVPGTVNLNLNGPDFISVAGAANNVIPTLRQPMTTEATGSFERELRENLAVHAQYVFRRQTGNFDAAGWNVARPASVCDIPVTRQDPVPDGRLGTPDDGGAITFYPAEQVRSDGTAVVYLHRRAPAQHGHAPYGALRGTARAGNQYPRPAAGQALLTRRHALVRSGCQRLQRTERQYANGDHRCLRSGIRLLHEHCAAPRRADWREAEFLRTFSFLCGVKGLGIAARYVQPESARAWSYLHWSWTMMPTLFKSKSSRGRAGRLLTGLMFAGALAGVSSVALTAGQAIQKPAAQKPAARKPVPRKPAAAPGRSVRPFRVEEATIADLHRAIQLGETTCKAVVQSYIERARAYDGTCTQLVTRDGARQPAVTGVVRAGSPTSFPTSSTPVASILPKFDEYAGMPLDFGRMSATSSDPAVHQEYGMVVGIPNAGQVNALSTLNIRGERSVSCKAQCDAPLSAGPLPASCPAVCTTFRKQPDALERAAELDAKYGRHPDLKAMPMYCVAFSFKDVYDTTDMRSTGGADVNYAMDAPPQDSTVVAELRAKGAIIYAKANLDEYNAGSGDPGGDAKVAARSYGAGARSTWGGPTCNPYDTARETGGSSSGSAASVAANLVQCSICEETGGSCRQPAWRNNVVALVTTKGLIPYGGAIGADPYLDRAGIQCRTVTDTARVLDALKDPKRGYFDPRDIYTALPTGMISTQPYASYAAPRATGAKAGKPLAGMRVGIVREYMVKHAANDAAMSDLVDAEIKQVLRDRLGAELVESVDPLYPDDPSIANMTYNFQQALAEILPFHMPEYLQKPPAGRAGRGGGESGEGGDSATPRADGALPYAVANYDITKRDYMVKTAEGQAPWSEKLNLRSANSPGSSASFGFNLAQYLLRRGDPRVKDWASLNANATYFSANRVAAMKNWENKIDLASDGMTQNIKMREVMRLVILKVMRQNNIDVLVNPTTTIPPTRIGYAGQPQINSRPAGRFPTSANLGIPEMTVPAGFNTTVYEPDFVLNAAKTAYAAVANNDRRSTLAVPLPVGISFWAGPGDEGTVIKAAAAYEAVTKHRKAPPAFGPVLEKKREHQPDRDAVSPQ
jgi:amidase